MADKEQCPGSGSFVSQDSVSVDGTLWAELEEGTEGGTLSAFCEVCEHDIEDLEDETAHGWHLPSHDRYVY